LKRNLEPESKIIRQPGRSRTRKEKKKKSHQHYYSMAAVLLLLAGLLVLAYYQVPRYEKRQVTSQETASTMESSFAYEVRAEQDTSLWASGEVLEQGRPLYFYSLDPALSLYPTLQATEPYQGEYHLKVHLQSENSDGDNYWSELIESRQGDVSLNDAADLEPVELSIPAIRENADSISDELNFGGGDHRVLVSLQAELEEETINHEIPFYLDRHGLVPPQNDKLTAKSQVTEEGTETVMKSRATEDYLQCGYFWIYAGGFIFLASIAFFTYRREHHSEYQKYHRLVAKASLELDKEPAAYFYHLKELIELAVELDKKVIYDQSRETYYVLDGDHLYAHVRKNKTDPIETQ